MSRQAEKLLGSSTRLSQKKQKKQVVDGEEAYYQSLRRNSRSSTFEFEKKLEKDKRKKCKKVTREEAIFLNEELSGYDCIKVVV